MTKKNKFKARVRARMDRTEESYIVARRHLADETSDGGDPPGVWLGDCDTNLVAWSSHHALTLVDELVAIVGNIRDKVERDRDELRRLVGGAALYNATKLATFGTGVAWDPQDRDVVMRGDWQSLRARYARELVGVPPQATFTEADIIEGLREKHGSELRATGFSLNMNGWHAEKTFSVLEALSELQVLSRGMPVAVRGALEPHISAATAAAQQLWRLAGSPKLLRSWRDNAARPGREQSEQAQFDEALRELRGSPVQETNVNHMTCIDMALLLAAANDDEAHHILWVDTNERVHLERLGADAGPATWSAENRSRVLLRRETFGRGNGYCGPRAASDFLYVKATLERLRSDLRAGNCGYVDG